MRQDTISISCSSSSITSMKMTVADIVNQPNTYEDLTLGQFIVMAISSSLLCRNPVLCVCSLHLSSIAAQKEKKTPPLLVAAPPVPLERSLLQASRYPPPSPSLRPAILPSERSVFEFACRAASDPVGRRFYKAPPTIRIVSDPTVPLSSTIRSGLSATRNSPILCPPPPRSAAEHCCVSILYEHPPPRCPTVAPALPLLLADTFFPAGRSRLTLRFSCKEGVIAGGTAGGVVESALYPIDTIKTHMIFWHTLFQAARGGGKIVWKGLYSGLAGNLVGVLPASALFVGVYEPVKQKLLKIFPENLTAFAHLTAGAIGGAAASLIRVPTEVVKQRMQTGQFTSAPEAIRLIVAKEGFGGLYAAPAGSILKQR
ncbi:hypothetical protein Taro_030259 [Colocasia esculenta]|uniref:Uncharacterized protein n=1 Tax=Colocasia esculenta TaxID=4460 RepID=A0A843VVN7_COLES|nr:hypothetical protein [Colocasia esculenta]